MEGVEKVPEPPSECLSREVVSGPCTRRQGAHELPADLGVGGGELRSLPRVHLRSNHGCGVQTSTAVGRKELLQFVTVSKQDPSRGWMWCSVSRQPTLGLEENHSWTSEGSGGITSKELHNTVAMFTRRSLTEYQSPNVLAGRQHWKYQCCQGIVCEK